MAKIDLADRLAHTRTRLTTEPGPATPGVPMFARLVRKEARVREDQYTALTTLARSLMGRRRVKAERITENTLIRVAIDFLLTHQHHLTGATEDDLRTSLTNTATPGLSDSVTPGLPNSQTPGVPASGTHRHRAGAGAGSRTDRKEQGDG